ncbi:hypothetical protein V6N12_024372 [Hibiscus sabdariffa]|uniref:RRM domain-containing protein n=1 Tax=Hibiscus sabdariffa TaxID=183260 RepID=A0ABR2G0D6_9ROSI
MATLIREESKGRRSSSTGFFTAFVDNLSKQVSRGTTLRELFNHYGKVSRVFISMNNHKVNYCATTFVFVRFEKEEDMEFVISKLNESIIDGRIIKVSKALYPGLTRADSTRDRFNPSSRKGDSDVSFKVASSELPWLKSSLVGVCKSLFSSEFNQGALISEEFHVKVTRWGTGTDAVLVSFENEDFREIVVGGQALCPDLPTLDISSERFTDVWPSDNLDDDDSRSDELPQDAHSDPGDLPVSYAAFPKVMECNLNAGSSLSMTMHANHADPTSPRVGPDDTRVIDVTLEDRGKHGQVAANYVSSSGFLPSSLDPDKTRSLGGSE